MKRTDGFDARRLRPRQHRSWGSRLGAALGLLLIVSGTLITGIGVASLFSSIKALASMPLDKEATVTLLTLGLVLLLLGAVARRRAHRRTHAPSGLSLSPQLKKRR